MPAPTEECDNPTGNSPRDRGQPGGSAYRRRPAAEPTVGTRELFDLRPPEPPPPATRRRQASAQVFGLFAVPGDCRVVEDEAHRNVGRNPNGGGNGKKERRRRRSGDRTSTCEAGESRGLSGPGDRRRQRRRPRGSTERPPGKTRKFVFLALPKIRMMKADVTTPGPRFLDAGRDRPAAARSPPWHTGRVETCDGSARERRSAAWSESSSRPVSSPPCRDRRHGRGRLGRHRRHGSEGGPVSNRCGNHVG